LKKAEVIYKEPGGIIWKILPDEAGNSLVIESRDGERRKTMLSVLDLSDNNLLYSTSDLPKPWWIGLIEVKGNKIIFQGYKESNSPEPKGFYIFDLLSGKLLQAEEEQIYESKDIREDQKSVFPLLYNIDNVHYSTIVEFLKKNHGHLCYGPLEYLEFGNNVLISFYIQENKKITNLLLVIDEEGNIVLNDRLAEGAEGVGLATFFICKNKLIYIKNKTSIGLVDML
jgi:hypothetical protein